MELFKKELKWLRESSSHTQTLIDQVIENRHKINNLLPEEKIAIYIYEKLHGFTNIEGERFDAMGNIWLEQVLEFTDKRAIRELKDESVWEKSTHKSYMKIARPLVKELSLEKAERIVNIIFPIIKNWES